MVHTHTLASLISGHYFSVSLKYKQQLLTTRHLRKVSNMKDKHKQKGIGG
jgi:hypothetical protein